MNHGTPRDNKMASELAPKEFETPMPFSPEIKRIYHELKIINHKYVYEYTLKEL